MLTIDQTGQPKSGEHRRSLRANRTAVDYIASKKIIDFESARRAFERDRSVDRPAEEQRCKTSHLRTPPSDSLVEWLVTVVLVVLLGLALLAGTIWGF
jgi:hypothetical protein